MKLRIEVTIEMEPGQPSEHLAAEIVQGMRDLEIRLLERTRPKEPTPEIVDIPSLSIERIKRAVAERFDVEPETLSDKGRTKLPSRIRMMAMYLCRKITDASYPEIGRAFGRRDHTTVMSAINSIGRLRLKDPAVHKLLQSIESQFGERSPDGLPVQASPDLTG